MRQLQTEHAKACISELSHLLSRSFLVHMPEAQDFSRAGHYIGQFGTGLRAGDALHLAIAANRDAITLYTLDNGMIRAGHILGLPVEGL